MDRMSYPRILKYTVGISLLLDGAQGPALAILRGAEAAALKYHRAHHGEGQGGTPGLPASCPAQIHSS